MSNISTPGSPIDALRTSGKLPSPEGVAIEVLRLSCEELVSNAEIVRVLQADPALAGRVLRAANGAALGLRRQIASLADAVMLLGLPIVRQIVLGFSLASKYRNGACEAFDYRQFWARSLLCGLAARRVATHLNVAAPEELFTCGLLSHVGKLALATVFPKEYAQLLQQHAAAPQTELGVMEQQCFGTDHTGLTVAMLQDWGLPQIYLQAVGALEAPEKIEADEGSRLHLVTHILHFADTFGEAGLGEDQPASVVRRKAIRLGLDAEAVAELCKELREQWAEWAQLLELPPLDITLEEGIAESQPESASKPADTLALRVLAVGDDHVMLNLLCELLNSTGHTVATARGRDEALAVAVKYRPQLLIADWDRSGKEGIELCRALRASAMGQSIHILIVTGSGDEESLVQAIEAGVDDYIVKPLHPRMLAARLRPVQRLQRLERERERQVTEVRSLAAELALNNRRLQQAAMTDTLTGLPNRRSALDRLEQAWAGSRSRGVPLSCIVVEVGALRPVSESCGPEASDALLRHVAAVLRQSARQRDAVCRIGDQKFCIICTNTSPADAGMVAERLRTAVAASPLRFDAWNLACSISYGIAGMEASIDSSMTLFSKADQALEAAKKEGHSVSHLSLAA
jgi:two-component system cell cycle response regulator